MPPHSSAVNKQVQASINELVQKSTVSKTSNTAVSRGSRNPVEGVTGSSAASQAVTSPASSGGVGLTAPLKMEVTQTKTVNIPVPLGATSVDVEVITGFTLTDSSETPVVLPVTVLDYP